MKIILNFIALFFLLNVSAQKNIDTIYGNPKSVREEVVFLEKSVPKRLTEYHSNIFRNITRYRRIRFKNFFRNINVNYSNCQIDFNNKGLKEKEFWYDFSKELERTFYYSYDENKNLTEEKEVFWDNEFWLTKRHYNHLNMLIARSIYFSEDPNEFVNNYILRDSVGYKIEYRDVNEGGINKITIHELDKQGKVIGEYRKPIENFLHKNYDLVIDLNKETNLREYEYDSNGNKILQLNYYGSTNRVYSKFIWKYDTQNKMIEQKRFGSMKDSTNYVLVKYKYNSKGFQTLEEETSTKKGKVKSVETTYNLDDYVIRSIIYENEIRVIIDFKYKYDRQGNWTKITKIVNGEPLYIWTRKIKYY